jgi:glycerophosphoryl diester phosphodiesterase
VHTAHRPPDEGTHDVTDPGTTGRRSASERPLVIAHRGHCVDAPEQTVTAYREAVRRGAEMIEADVRMSRDGRLVMMHDATLDRTTSGSGPVSAFTWDELRTLDAGSWFDPEFAGERIPSLDDLFDLAQDASIPLCIEAKGGSAQETRSISLAIAEQIARRDRLHSDVLASFDHAALVAARAATPGVRTAPDRLPERGPSAAADLVRQARSTGARIVQHHHADLVGAVVADTQGAGVDIWAWPTTARDDIDRALRIGVAGVMGDDVSAMVDAVAAAFGDRT